MDEQASLEQVVELEQYFIDTIKPNLNVDLVASGTGFHSPMSMEAKEKLRKQRGTPVYVYKADDFTLLYVFDSIQYMTDSVGIHRPPSFGGKVKASFILIQNKTVVRFF